MKRFLVVVLLLCLFALGAVVATSQKDFIQGLYAQKKQAGASSASMQATGCTDSDGGRVAAEKGTTCVGGSCLFDRCDGEAAVIEHYCAGEEVTWEVVPCEGGCLDGACAAATQ